MSKYFVTDPPVAVYEGETTEGNVIWIKARMDVETRSRVRSELATLGADGKTAEMRAGFGDLGLLVHNIVRWAGPDLDSMPCTPVNIRKLDPTEPHIGKVLNEIATRNAPRVNPNPKAAAGNGSLRAGSPESRMPAPAAPSVSQQLATGIVRSSSPSDSAGPPSKSGD